MSDKKLYIHQWAYDILQKKQSGLTFYGWMEKYPGPVEGVTRITWEDGVPMKAENWAWDEEKWMRDDEYIYKIVSGGGPGSDDWVSLTPEQAEEVLDGLFKT